jgi:FkbM family methyltransferase
MSKDKYYDVEGFKMYLDDEGVKGIRGVLKRDRGREPAFMWILRKEASGALGIDLGANIGYTTVSLCNNMEKVIAIEPDGRCKKSLLKTIKANGFQDKLTYYKFAMSDKVGDSYIHYAEKHCNLNTLCDPTEKLQKNHNFKKKKIETMTIDSLSVDPNFIKMDIEGYEVEALRGGMETFKRADKCKLLIEVHPQYYSEERNFAIVLEQLFSFGFNIKYVVSAGVSCPDLFKEKGYKPIREMRDKKHMRGIYNDISNEDALEFSSYVHRQKNPETGKVSEKIVRSILLVKE